MPIQRASNGSQPHVVDFGIGAPDGAACNADLEFTRHIVKVGVPDQQSGGLRHQRRGVANLVAVDPSQRAARDVSSVVTAGAHGGEPRAPQLFEQIGERFDRHPVQLHVLTDGEVGHATRVAAHDVCDGAYLV